MAGLAVILDEVRADLRALSEHSPPEARLRPLIENFFLAIYHLGTALEQDPALREQANLPAFFQELEPGLRDNMVFLESYPQDVIAKYQTTWEGGEWEQLCRLRSAIQFLVDLTHGTPIADEISAIHVEIEDLDDHLRRWGDKEGGLNADAVDPGIPASHWWWRYPEP
jgi:hypothetical protein